MNHIVVGVKDLIEGGERRLADELTKAGYPCEAIRKNTKDGVYMEASGSRQISGVILTLNLEVAKPYTMAELEGLCSIREDLRIVILLPEKERGTSLIEDLFNTGIYNALVGDISYPKIAELLKRGRTRQSARIYYQLNTKVSAKGSDDDADEERFKKLSTFLSVESDEIEREKKASSILQMLGEKQFREFTNYLPQEIKDKFAGTDHFRRYFNTKRETRKEVRPVKAAPVKTEGNNVAGIIAAKLAETSKKGLDKTIEVAKKASTAGIELIKRHNEITAEEKRLKSETLLEMRYAQIYGEVEEQEQPKMRPKKQGIKVSEKSVISDNDTSEESPLKAIKEKRKKASVIPDSLSVAIFALSGGVGSSHLADSIAVFSKKFKRNVCIVDFKKSDKTQAERYGIPVYSRGVLDDLYDRYEYIILDIGSRIEDKTVLPEIKRAKVKILMALNEEMYLERMAAFIRKYSEAGSMKWKYVFNHIPKNRIKKVDALMEDYEHYCLPLFDAEYISEEAEEILEKLLKGGS